jgi:hypothetical protein
MADQPTSSRPGNAVPVDAQQLLMIVPLHATRCMTIQPGGGGLPTQGDHHRRSLSGCHPVRVLKFTETAASGRLLHCHAGEV